MDWSRGSKFKDGIRIAAGAYLIYLAVTIIKQGIIDGGMTGKSYVIGILASILFLVFGVAVIIFSIKSIVKTNRELQEENAQEEENGTTADDDKVPVLKDKADAGNDNGGSQSIFNKAMGSINSSDSRSDESSVTGDLPEKDGAEAKKDI